MRYPDANFNTPLTCPWCRNKVELKENGITGSLYCPECGLQYVVEGNKLKNLNESWLQNRHQLKCQFCPASLDNGASSTAYEDGNNSEAYIICPRCKRKNFFSGFGSDN